MTRIRTTEVKFIAYDAAAHVPVPRGRAATARKQGLPLDPPECPHPATYNAAVADCRTLRLLHLPTAAATPTEISAQRRSIPHLNQNKRLATAHKTPLPVPAHQPPDPHTPPPATSTTARLTPPHPFPRTVNRPLVHNCAISLNIRYSDINGSINNSNHINRSRSSNLILWNWPLSCYPILLRAQ